MVRINAQQLMVANHLFIHIQSATLFTYCTQIQEFPYIQTKMIINGCKMLAIQQPWAFIFTPFPLSQ